MKILLISQDPPLDPREVATGNALRAAQLSHGLEQAGHSVTPIWLDQLEQDPNRERVFNSIDSLRQTLQKHEYDVLLVGYWELLEFLPQQVDKPVVLDFVAPRPLELLFEEPESMQRDLLRLRINLAKADCFIVGTERQRHLLIPLLLQAGLDIRPQPPIVTIPISAWLPAATTEKPMPDALCNLVAGGVDWPWRDSSRYWQAFRDWKHRDYYRLIQFGGAYKHHQKDHQAQEDQRAMTGYRAYRDELWQWGHIGVELAEPNVERYFAQSFRSLEFLSSGMPVIVNPYTSLSRLVAEYDAGWLVSDPGEFIATLVSIQERNGLWRQKSDNAIKLAAEKLSIDLNIKPLLEYLQNPRKCPPLAAVQYAGPDYPRHPPKLAVPGPRERLSKQLALIKESVFSRHKHENPGSNVVMVTRDDLFPCDHGAAVKIIETARGLSQNGLQVGLVTDNRKHWWLFQDGEYQTVKYPLWLRLLALPKPLVKLLHMSKDIPKSNSFLYLPLSDRSYAWRALHVGKRLNAGVYQAEFPAYLRACIWGRSVLGGKAVLVEHNVEYRRLQDQLPDMSERQYENLKAIEIGLANQCDAVICVSENDRQILARDGVHASLLHTIPHGVDLQQLAAQPAADLSEYGIEPGSPVLVYHGTFDYPPNMEALQVFAEQLLPRLKQLGQTVKVLAVGRNPPQYSPHPDIVFSGSVEAVGPCLKAADVAVVPLLDGGGTRMKIIDYFAACIPVVSTSKGIEGIPATHGKEALIHDDWDDMAAAIADLLSKPQQAKALTEAAWQYAQSLDWKHIAQHYISVFAKAEALV